MARRPKRFSASCCLLSIVALMLAAWHVAEAAAPTPGTADSLASSTPARSRALEESAKRDNDSQDRIREGTRVVEKIGRFQATGDRLTFYANDGKLRIRCLENLMLERIARMIGETPGDLEWTINGTVTEFRGSNFLLVTRAMLRTHAHTDTDDPLSGAKPATLRPATR